RLAAVFDEGRHPVAQKLGHGEGGVEREGGRGSLIAVLEVTRIAFDDLALRRNGNFQKRLPVIHGPPGIGDQPMRGAMPGMHVGVDEAWTHEFALGVDGAVDAAFEFLSDVEDPVVLEDNLAVAQERVMTALMAHHPCRLDLAAHVFSPRPRQQALERLPLSDCSSDYNGRRHIVPSPACNRTRVYPSSVTINGPKSDKSDFGWRDREGAATMIGAFSPAPSPALPRRREREQTEFEARSDSSHADGAPCPTARDPAVRRLMP